MNRTIQQIRDAEIQRQLDRCIDVHQRVDAALGTCRGNRLELTNRGIAQAAGEVGNHEDMIRLGDFTGLGIVFVDRGEFITQIFLHHPFHVVGQECESFFDLTRIGPNAFADELFVVVGQMHEAREILPQRHRIDDRKPQLSRGNSREETKHHDFQQFRGNSAPRPLRGDHHARLLVERHPRGKHQLSLCGNKPRVLRDTILDSLQWQLAAPELDHGGNRRRSRPILPGGVIPIGEELVTRHLHGVEFRSDVLKSKMPAISHLFPVGGVPRLCRGCALRVSRFIGLPGGLPIVGELIQ